MPYCQICRTEFTDPAVRICTNGDEVAGCIAQQAKIVRHAQSIEARIETIVVKIMQERAGTGRRMTLPEWQDFLRKQMTPT
jgi:hypothetical protein